MEVISTIGTHGGTGKSTGFSKLKVSTDANKTFRASKVEHQKAQYI
jgi:hypothetical protein